MTIEEYESVAEGELFLLDKHLKQGWFKKNKFKGEAERLNFHWDGDILSKY